MNGGSLARLNLAAIPAEDEALRFAVRTFLTNAIRNMPADQRARSWAGFNADFSKELGRRGWLGITFPERYGGAGRSAFARYVVAEECLNIGAPVGAHWIADRQSGPLILKYGTASQKDRYLPSICRGESYFCIGMSEPNAGSDLANVRTRATKQGNLWCLNGQKLWTTLAHRCHYMIALVRTGENVTDRQHGLSQFVVDLSLPGVTIRPIQDLSGDHHFCEVFFENVLLELDSLIGEQGNGWAQVLAELAFERSGPERFYTSIVLFNEWIAYARSNPGRTPQSSRLAGKILSHLASIRGLSLAVTASLQRGESPIVEAALVKDLGTELEQFIPQSIAAELFSSELEPLPASLVGALDYTTGAAVSYSLRGGTRQILRGMIARGLGLR